ncbi:hypothetical protein UlMin_042193 [Ulmus minor]
MVLSNKKLKQKLRAELAESLTSSVAQPQPNNGGTSNPDPASLKLLLDSATQKPRLTKREKRRNLLGSRGSEAVNSENFEENKAEEEKKKSGSEGFGERKRKRDGEEKDEILGEEGNGVVKEADELKEKKNKSKNKKKKLKQKRSKKAKMEAAETGNEEQTGVETNKESESQPIPSGDVPTKVYVGGIPYYSTEDDIRSYFEGCGTMTEVDCMKFPETGKFRGIAIISFKTEAAAKRALALNGADMGGLFLTIQPYKTVRMNKSSDFAPKIVDGYNRVYVGNLSWDITEDKLRTFFSDCKVSSIRLGKDKETGEFRGYAHVDFSDGLSLTMALKLDQKVFCGRPVKISCAVPLKKAGSQSSSLSTNTETASTNNGLSAAKMKGLCYRCGEKGHISSDCPNKQTIDQINTETAATVENKETAATVENTETDASNNALSYIATGKMKRRTCYECGEKGHVSSDCPKKQTAAPTIAETAEPGETGAGNNALSSIATGKMKRRTCYECGEKGHVSTDCPKKQTPVQTNTVQTNLEYAETGETAASNDALSAVASGKIKRRKCYLCGEKGHLSSDCSNK